jgi:Mn-dependent DtxR family transcriptional regulator
MPDYTEKQGQYLAFIHNYTLINGRPPAEADMQRFFRVSPPTVHQMVLKLEERGFITREPGKPRTIRVLVSPDQLPYLKGRSSQDRGRR